ncbi:MAG: TonB-dependent receptor [Gammaproteobacteria bacterium]|nr:TonB-dependent receptor [Gammaproteobacteria bacterium]
MSGYATAEPATANQSLEEVIITGSQIKGNPDAASSNPITVIGPAELRNSNSLDIQAVLAKLPAVGSDGLNNAESSNFGGNGFEYVDLRNLGPQRTLILVDGQRFVTSANAGAFAGVDFNNIPAEFVDHIEVLRDGASPIYGSDAVAGVINIITRQHFSGAELNASGGQTGKSDKRTYSASVTLGNDFERGNFIFNIGYNKADPVYARDRTWAGSISGSGNSGYLPDGHFQGTKPDGSSYDLQGNGHGGFVTAPVAFDTTRIPNLFGATTRKTVNAAARYELNPGAPEYPVQLVTQIMYTDRSNFGIANPDPQVGVACTPTAAPGCANQHIGGLPGPLDPDAPGGASASFPFRSSVIGNRVYLTDVQTYRMLAGFEGTLHSKFSWEMTFAHGQSDGQAHTLDLVDMVNLASFSGDINNLTAADLALLRVNTTDILRTAEDTFTARISGPALGLPAGDLSFAAGGDVRRESLSDTPDYANATGRTDQGGTPTTGKYDLKEGFLELNVPILKDRALARQLTFNGAARYSKYSNFGDATTWKTTLNWAPSATIRIRGTLSTSFRAPTIQELYLANTTTFSGVSDPCDANPLSNSLLITSGGAAHAIVQANCNAALSAAGVNPAAFQPSLTGSQQIPGISGGNPNLTPEKTRGLTIGVVLTPGSAPRLQLTADYWRIRLRNQIIQIPDAQTALNLCYASPGLSDPACATIGARTPVPISGQPTAGGISSQSLTSLNSGAISTDGIDFGIDYSFALGGDAGRLSFSDAATVTRSFLAADQSGAINDFLGKIQQTSSPFTSANPKFQNRLMTTWTRGDWSLAWSARFIGSVVRYTDPNAPPADCATRGDCLPGLWYHDLVASRAFGKVALIGGIDNALDRDPPYFRDTVGRTNSNPFVYDYLGRYLYLKAVARL